jgi:hypothetical protein
VHRAGPIVARPAPSFAHFERTLFQKVMDVERHGKNEVVSEKNIFVRKIPGNFPEISCETGVYGHNFKDAMFSVPRLLPRRHRMPGLQFPVLQL